MSSLDIVYEVGLSIRQSMTRRPIQGLTTREIFSRNTSCFNLDNAALVHEKLRASSVLE